MRANAQIMKAAVKPVIVAMARFLWVASRVMIGRLIDMAINTKPARAAAPPPTMMKKLFHWSIPMALYDTRKKINRARGRGFDLAALPTQEVPRDNIQAGSQTVDRTTTDPTVTGGPIKGPSGSLHEPGIGRIALCPISKAVQRRQIAGSSDAEDCATAGHAISTAPAICGCPVETSIRA